MHKIHHFCFAVAIVICVGIASASTYEHVFRIARKTNQTHSPPYHSRNVTTGREKRTLLYLVSDKETNSSCNASNKCTKADESMQLQKLSNQNPWSIYPQNILKKNIQQFSDQPIALPSNQIRSYRQPAFQTLHLQDPRETLRNILLSKYPNQRSNIDHLFNKIQANTSPQKIRESLFLNNNTNSNKKKRSKSSSKESDRTYASDSNRLSIKLANSRKMKDLAAIPPENLGKLVENPQTYKITGRATLPLLVHGIFDDNQQSKINIPFASNVNFDQRVFLLNKNPYISPETRNQQAIFAQYPHAVSVHSLTNPNVNLNDENSLKKKLCIQQLKDEAGQKKFKMNDCVKLFNNNLCSSSSTDNCDNIETSVPMEFNDGFYDAMTGLQANNYDSSRQTAHSNSLNLNQNEYPIIYNSPYLVSNQYLVSSLLQQKLYDALLSNVAYNNYKNHHKIFLCHIVNEDDIVIDVRKCDEHYKHAWKSQKEDKKVESQTEISNTSKNTSVISEKINTTEIEKESSKKINLKDLEEEFKTTIRPKFLSSMSLVRGEWKPNATVKSKTTKSSEDSKKGNVHYILPTTIPSKFIEHMLHISNSSAVKKVNSSHYEDSKSDVEFTMMKSKNNTQKNQFTADLQSVSQIYDALQSTRIQEALKATTEVPTTYHPITDQIDKPIKTDSLHATKHFEIYNKTSKETVVKETEDRLEEKKLVNLTNIENKEPQLLYNLTTLDLQNFPCTKHLVSTTEGYEKSTFQVRPFLRTIIKQVVNDLVNKNSHKSVKLQKVKDIEVENSNEAYVLPVIIDTPVLKNVFNVPQVETVILNDVQNFLAKVSDLSHYVAMENITESLIRSEIQNFVQNIPLVHPTVATTTEKQKNEVSEKNKQILINGMEVPSNFLLSTLHKIISQSKIGMQAARNDVVQRVIVKAVKNSLMSSKNPEKTRIKESEIQNALDYLLGPQSGSKPTSGQTTILYGESLDDIKTEKYTLVTETSILTKPRPEQNIKNNVAHMEHKKHHQSQSSFEHYSGSQKMLSNEEIHSFIASTIKSLHTPVHKHSTSTSKSIEDESIDDMLDSMEKKPIKYYSQSDRILDYIKNHSKDKDSNYKSDENKMELDKDTSTKKLTSDERMENTMHSLKYQKPSSGEKKVETVVKTKTKFNTSEEDYISLSQEERIKETSYKNEPQFKSDLQHPTVKTTIIKIKTTRVKPQDTKGTTPKIRYIVRKTTLSPRSQEKTSTEKDNHESESTIQEDYVTVDGKDKMVSEEEHVSGHLSTASAEELTESTENLSNKAISEMRFNKFKYHHSKQSVETEDKVSEEYSGEVIKNQGFGNKLFTVSNESENEDEGTTRYNTEANFATLSLSTKSSPKIRTPRTTQPSKRHNHEKVNIRTQRTTNPSFLYDDNYYSYSTSAGISAESYDDVSNDFPKEASIPSPYEINTESNVRDLQSVSSNEYNVHQTDLLNSVHSSRSREGTTENYYYDHSEDSTEGYPEALEYHQEPTAIVKKYTAKRDHTQKNCDHKTEPIEDVPIDITRINEEFSTTTQYSTDAPRTTRQYHTTYGHNNFHSRDHHMKFAESEKVKTRGYKYDIPKTTTTTSRPKVNQINNNVLKTHNKKTTTPSAVTTKKDPLFIGKLLPKRKPKVLNDLDGLDLFYIGDGVKLPIVIKKQPDGSFSLSLSDNICELILKRKCPCCQGKHEEKQQRTAKSQNYPQKEYKDNRRIRARRSHEPFRITLGDGLGVEFRLERSEESQNSGTKESVNIDDVAEKDREQVVLNALENLTNLEENEIDSIVNEVRERVDSSSR